MFLTNILNAVVTFLGGALATVAKIDPAVATLPVFEQVSNDLNGYKVLEANYAADYADIAPFSHDGVEGRVLVVRKGGPLAQYLNIS